MFCYDKLKANFRIMIKIFYVHLMNKCQLCVVYLTLEQIS